MGRFFGVMLLAGLMTLGARADDLPSMTKQTIRFVQVTEAARRSCLSVVRNSNARYDCFDRATQSYMDYAQADAEAAGELDLFLRYEDQVKACEAIENDENIFKASENAVLCKYLTARYVVLPAITNR